MTLCLIFIILFLHTIWVGQGFLPINTPSTVVGGNKVYDVSGGAALLNKFLSEERNYKRIITKAIKLL